MVLKANKGFVFESGKVYAHSVGLSCVFRQWRATDSHCKFLHGYALKVEFKFQNLEGLDYRNWVMGFGDLKPIKKWLEDTFDHKTLVAVDDPDYMDFIFWQNKNIIQLSIVEATGCEAFAKMIFEAAESLLPEGIRLMEVKVSEHESNWALYRRKQGHDLYRED